MDIYVITKSIGQLKQTQFNAPGFKKNDYQLYMTDELIRSWFDYGNQYTSQFEIFLDNESKPININGTIFDNKISFYCNTGSALAYGHLQDITLYGKTSKGEVFESRLRWHNLYGSRLNPSTTIIYCMILISIFGPKKIKWLINVCFGEIEIEGKSLGDLISMIEEIKSIFTKAKKEYDFLELFYQECIKHIIDVTHVKLSQYNILK